MTGMVVSSRAVRSASVTCRSSFCFFPGFSAASAGHGEEPNQKGGRRGGNGPGLAVTGNDGGDGPDGLGWIHNWP